MAVKKKACDKRNSHSRNFSPSNLKTMRFCWMPNNNDSDPSTRKMLWNYCYVWCCLQFDVIKCSVHILHINLKWRTRVQNKNQNSIPKKLLSFQFDGSVETPFSCADSIWVLFIASNVLLVVDVVFRLLHKYGVWLVLFSFKW